MIEIFTEPDDVEAVRDALTAAGYTLDSAERSMVPNNTVELSNDDDIRHMELLLEKLDEDDDVSDVYHNWQNED